MSKQEVLNRFRSGMTPDEEDYALLINGAHNERFELALQKVVPNGTISTNNGTASNITADTYNLAITGAYHQSGHTYPSAQGKKFVVFYEVEHVSGPMINRWGYRAGYNTTGTGIATSDEEFVIPHYLTQGSKYKGYFIQRQTNTRAYFIPVIFSNGNGAQLKIKMSTYDITSLTEDTILGMRWEAFILDTAWPGEKLNIDFILTAAQAGYVPYHNSTWRGKTAITLGDSVTSQGSYQTLLKEALGFARIINKGVAGSPVETFADNVTEQELQSADVVTLYGCFNNFGNGAPVAGAVTDTPSATGNTFAARMKYTIEKLLALDPDINLIIIATHQGQDSGRTIEGMRPRIAMMEQLAAYYGFPFINLFERAGINATNLATFTGDGIHLLPNGYRRIAVPLIGDMLRLQPLG